MKRYSIVNKETGVTHAIVNSLKEAMEISKEWSEYHSTEFIIEN